MWKDSMEKLLEKLINQNWVIFCLSIVLGFISYYFVPSDYVEMMPFSDHNINVAVCIFLLCLVLYLILSFLRSICKKLISVRDHRKNDKYWKKRDEQDFEDTIERIRSDIDGLTDYDYNAIMFLIENENKVPFKQKCFLSSHSVLDDDNWFVSCPYEEVPVLSTYRYFNQYLLKPDKYALLKHIIEKKGSLSHFDRKRDETDL